MKGIFEDSNGVPIEIEIDDSIVVDIIGSLSNEEIPFFRLENKNGDYLQCAGNGNTFTVELRLIRSPDFKHYVIGRPVQSKIWQMIYCSVGPIRVLENEVLSKDEVVALCLSFTNSGNLVAPFISRNVTKLYK